ncbi:hypothetical protein [Mucilaginibacter aquaedulcis]|uniref:hypothetical protein n=1 Tax=Mucilaginibacter aquaedulcis TaxID=1187081 RepID=UPI0025B45420|nr:hypothetical protein [Mucilaginibacter aquaedulcis]MDN3551599.1 hypothetical protein [Mucilaginibacter aquaedulcis]
MIGTPKQHRETVGKFAAAFFAALFPGNIAQYPRPRNGFGLDTDHTRLIRLAFQPLLIYRALESTQS